MWILVTVGDGNSRGGEQNSLAVLVSTHCSQRAHVGELRSDERFVKERMMSRLADEARLRRLALRDRMRTEAIITQPVCLRDGLPVGCGLCFELVAHHDIVPSLA